MASHPLRTIGRVALRVEWTRYGRDAAEALRSAVAAVKQDDPLAPVTVVVPSNHVGVSARRRLATAREGAVCSRGTGLAAVTFVTPYRLAELLGAATLAGAGRRPVSTPVLAAAMRNALRTQPGVFAPVAEHPATESALVDAYRELRDLTPDALRTIASASRRAHDVVRLHVAAREQLQREWYDEEDLMVSSAEALERGERVDELGAVVVYLPQRLSGHTIRVLDAAARHLDVHVLAGFTAEPGADAEITASLARLQAAHTEPPRGDSLDVVAAERTRIITTSDADDEVRAAVRAVVDAARAGTPLDRIAVLYASAEPYARIAHEQLDAAGIRTNGAAVVPVAARIAGRALLRLLALPDAGFRRQDVFAWLAGTSVVHAGRPAPVAAWERLSREAAVVARTDWDTRLDTLALDLETRAKAEAADPDVDDWIARRHVRDAARARELRAFALELIADLDAAAARPRPWSDHARWGLGVLERVLGGPTRRDRWPDVERKAAERVELALHRLAALDAVEGPVGLDVFTRTLELELESDLGRIGRLGTGVLVGSIGMGVGLDLDLVVVLGLGLAEGSFPSPVRDDSLLPDREREGARGELVLATQRVERQHRELLATLATSARHVLGVPRGDLRRSRELVPSRWVVAIASRLGGERVASQQLLQPGSPWASHISSFADGLRTMCAPATDQEFRLRALLAHAGERFTDAVLTQATRVVDARRSDEFTAFDGNLGGLAIPSPVDHATSATRLERWAKCPFDYFMHDVLHVERVENPEEELQMTPLVRGELVHRILEQFILEVLGRPAPERPAPDTPWSPADHERMRAIADELCDKYEAAGLAGRPIFWRRDRASIHADVDTFLTVDDERRRTERTRPIAAELAFGFDGAATVPVTLPDRRTLHFRGKADRVDLSDDGTIRIVDYKTGSRRDFKGLSEADPDQRGTRLQLVVYGLAARHHRGDLEAPVHAEYWFVSRRGEFAPVGYPVTDEVLRRVCATLGTIVSGIEAGVFPNHPNTVSSKPWVDCDSCDPDGLGITELRARWERKRHDDALTGYADLAEPRDEDVPCDDEANGD